MSKVILSKEQITKIVNNVVTEQFEEDEYDLDTDKGGGGYDEPEEDDDEHHGHHEIDEQEEVPSSERYTVAKGEDGTYYILNQVTGKIIAKK